MSEIRQGANYAADAVDPFNQLLAYMVLRFGAKISLRELGLAINKSPDALCKSFRRRYKLTPIRWLWEFRTHLASECLLLYPQWRIKDVAILCGFGSQEHFSRYFSRLYHCSPKDFRKKYMHHGEQIPNLRNISPVMERFVIYAKDNLLEKERETIKQIMLTF